MQRSYGRAFTAIAIALHFAACSGDNDTGEPEPIDEDSGSMDAGRSDGRSDVSDRRDSALDANQRPDMGAGSDVSIPNDARDATMAVDSRADVGSADPSPDTGAERVVEAAADIGAAVDTGAVVDARDSAPSTADVGADRALTIDASVDVDSGAVGSPDSAGDADSSSALGDAADSSTSPEEATADANAADSTAADSTGAAADASDAGMQCILPTGSRTLVFETQFLNLDTGTISMASGPGPGEPSDPGWDLVVIYNSVNTVHAVVFHNEVSDQIAHLRGRTFSSVTSDDVATASFQSGLIDEPFDNTRAILIRTDTGAVFAIGNPVETGTDVTFDTERIDFGGCTDGGDN